jgi:hypothetical protein
MKAKNILKTLALSMLLVSACNKMEIADEENTEKKGFALPVTVNVTREGDDATKATYNETSKKLEFSAGDKLLVRGNDNSDGGAGSFAGMLDYDTENENFKGTIYTQNEYSGTADELLTAATANWVGATLFPKGYENYEFLAISGSGYYTSYSMSYNKAIAATKVAAVEQLSLESAKKYAGGFALSPENAILNFTITGLTDEAKDVVLKNGSSNIFTGSVTPSSGTAAFALGVRTKDYYESPVNLKNLTLTVGGTDIDITDTNNYLAVGKIYNINRSASAPLPAVFTVDAGKTVKFSKGNLQATYNGSSWIWGFAEHQWDYIGNAAGNTSINGNGTVSANGTVDLFGWVGASSTWTGAAQYGISNSTATNNVDGYGNVGSEAQKVGWGATVGTGWRTLTRPEWLHLLNERETGVTVNSTNHARYTMAIINTDGTAVKGLIIFPDSYAGGSPAGVTWGTINAISTFETTCTSAGWTALEAAGCVFLPAAGYREASNVTDAGIGAGYWSCSSGTANTAIGLYFESNWMGIQFNGSRKYGFSVRLVRDAD